MIDFTQCGIIPGRAYNGANGNKIAVSYNGTVYMLKFPPSAAGKPTELSYTNGCISEHLASSEALKVLQTFVNLSLRLARYLAEERKILLGRQEVDEETLVNVGPYDVLPLLAFGRIDAVDGYCSFVGFQQIEHDAEECTLAGTVVTYQTQYIAIVNSKRGDITGDGLTKLFLEIANGNHNSQFSIVNYTSPLP